MKALILAAGIGSRLAPITDDIPKSMVSVNGKPILIKQIDNLYQNDVKDITIIAGYKADVLKSAINSLYPDIKIIFSKDYAITNNMFSAWLGKSEMYGQDFLMMNADVFFDESVISSLLKCPYENAIAVDIGNFIEESMKVIENNEKLVAISKSISQINALGSSIDVYKFSSEAGKAFFEKCEDYIIKLSELKKWSEVAINDILSSIVFKACKVDGRWIEIDNHEDLYAAEKIFADTIR